MQEVRGTCSAGGKGGSVSPETHRPGPGQSRAVSGLTSTVPGGPSWYQCSRTWCRSTVPSGRLSSPSGSWAENRLKLSTCTCRVVWDSSSCGTCGQAVSWTPCPLHGPWPRLPHRPSQPQTHVEAAGLLEHGAERVTVHLRLVPVSCLGGEADASVRIRRAARAPGPQVCGLLEAHSDLGARSGSARGPPRSAPHPVPARHPTPLRTPADPLGQSRGPHTSWLPKSYSRESCRRPQCWGPPSKLSTSGCTWSVGRETCPMLMGGAGSSATSPAGPHRDSHSQLRASRISPDPSLAPLPFSRASCSFPWPVD